MSKADQRLKEKAALHRQTRRLVDDLQEARNQLAAEKRATAGELFELRVSTESWRQTSFQLEQQLKTERATVERLNNELRDQAAKWAKAAEGYDKRHEEACKKMENVKTLIQQALDTGIGQTLEIASAFANDRQYPKDVLATLCRGRT